jgi:LDH2 family malate/lactate/ureidoglycolate dehydrogenase
VLDADNGMGHITAAWSMDLCIKRAKEKGTAFAALRNTNHTGAMAYYAEMATKQNMIGFCVTDTAANLAPWGGTMAMLGNNPFAVGIPASRHFPIILDMAISMAAKGKVIKAATEGHPIPEGWVTDPKGYPITDPELIVGPMDKRIPFLLQPIGGAKGSGILVVTTILAGILSGTENYGPTLPNFGSQFEKTQHLGCFFGVIDPACFLPINEFKSKVDGFIDVLKDSSLSEWTDAIYMPGERECIERESRYKNGIPIQMSVWKEIEKIQKSL